jgi:hypothetical protein
VSDESVKTLAMAAADRWDAAGARQAAQELRGIGDRGGLPELSVLEKLTDLAAEELAGKSRKSVRWMRGLRNAIAAILLLFTLVVLAVAAKFYQDDVTARPAARSSSLILLWEQRFGGRLIPTVTQTIFADVVLLAIIGILGLLASRSMNSVALKSLEVRTQAARLEIALGDARPRLPASAEEWAAAAERVMTDAMGQNRLFAASSRRAIEDAVGRLADIQDDGRDFIARFSTEIQSTLVSVRDQNEQFIVRAGREGRETLRHLVDQEMEPLLSQVRVILAEWASQQGTYQDGITDLTSSLASIGALATLTKLTDSHTAMMRSQEDLHKDIRELLDWLRAAGQSGVYTPHEIMEALKLSAQGSPGDDTALQQREAL